jgi:hypothetical protein
MSTSTAALPSPVGPAAPGLPHRGWWRQLGVDTGFVLLGLPLSIAAFVAVLTGLVVGAGLVIIWVGLPLLVLTLVVARGLATLERTRIPDVLGRQLPTPVYRRATPDASLTRRSPGWTWCTRCCTWRCRSRPSSWWSPGGLRRWAG